MSAPANKLRIVVVGRSGQLASCLRELQQSPHAVVCFGRPILDLLDLDGVKAFRSWAHPEVVVNTAAYTAVDRAEDVPGLAAALNGDAAEAVALYARLYGVPLIHISTDYVFDGSASQPYTETDPIAPLGVYGRTKADGEARVRDAMRDHVILRAAWLYSAHGSNFVKTMLRLGRERDEVAVVDDQVGSPTSAHDLARLIIGMAERLCQEPQNAALRGTFHAGGPSFATWADVAEATFAAAEAHGRRPVRVRRITTAEYPTRAQRPANSRLDGGKLAATYGLTLPDWRASLPGVVARILAAEPQEPHA